MWRYTRHESKLLLIATLFLFAGYGVLVAADWQASGTTVFNLTASVVGVNASIAGTTENTIAAQLKQKEHELDKREAALLESQAALLSPSRGLLLTTIGGFLLLVLILLNFYLDTQRRLSLAP